MVIIVNPSLLKKGVRQGCKLSFHLFNIDTEHIMRHADVKSLGVNLGGGDVTNLRYADDAALLSDNNNKHEKDSA